MPIPQFTELYFGKSDSKNEAISNPTEFIKSFVNLSDTVGAALTGEKFLVLGPKGTGKSAVAWYLKATESSGRHVALIRDASSLPLAEVPHLQTGQPPGPERTVIAWKFILLVNYLELLLKSEDSPLRLDGDAVRINEALGNYGFTGDISGRALLTASKETWRVPIPQVGEIYSREKTQDLNIFHLVPHLERLVSFAGPRIPILLLDGLDSIFLNDVKYNQSLASLVQAAYSLNQTLRMAGANGNIVLLLRNDVFSRVSVSLPDSQKMRDDFAIQLDWRVLSGARGLQSPLLQLVNSKAARALEVDFVDVLGYFRKDVRIGPAGRAPKWDPTLRYLLNLTRHTPRDLLRLFESIRTVQSEQPDPPEKYISEIVLREGVQRYSHDYFVGAIKNEFAGYPNGEEAALAGLASLRHLNKTTFTRQEFSKAYQEETGSSDPSDIKRLLQLFFFAGGLGNYISTSRESYMQFYHRNDDVDIHLGGTFVLANPLAYAWNIPFTHG